MIVKTSGFGRLTRFESVIIWVWPLLILLMGVMVVKRSAFSERRMTDIGCFQRAGWAVLTGNDIYSVTDDNDWHFTYPPIASIFFTFMADAPQSAERGLMLPYVVSVVLWYLITVAAWLLTIHWLANLFERHLPEPTIRGTPLWSRRWIYMRTLPMCLCVMAVGCTISRGQPNLLLVFLLALSFIHFQTGRKYLSGFWIACATGMKLIPVFMIIYPLWKRDYKTLAGFLGGMVLLVAVIPSAVWGPGQALDYHQRFLNVVVFPTLNSQGDQSRARELHDLTATDNQSFQAVIHYYRYPVKADRPDKGDEITKGIHVVLSLGMLAATCLLAGRRSGRDPVTNLIFFGQLMVVMMLASPMCHLHYFVFCIPLLVGTIFWLVRKEGGFVPKLPGLAVLIVVGLLLNLPDIPFHPRHKEFGLSLFASMILWSFSTWAILSNAKATTTAKSNQFKDPPQIYVSRAA